MNATCEIVDILAWAGRTRVERIVSHGQVSPPGFWYDQPEDELVTVVSGAARLVLEGPNETIEMRAGSWVQIAAHRRHRVEWTDPHGPTVWLAVFY